MSRTAQTAERIYVALKRELSSGRFRPGMPLPLRSLAREFETSVSPVRDAMVRLAGERILEAHPAGGFQRPALREKDLRQLYGWHAHLLGLLLRDRKPGWSISDLSPLFEVLDPADSSAIADATAALFCRIAECSDNVEHVEALRMADARLRAIRISEADIPDRVAELRAVAAATADGNHRAARTAIWAYQRRRLRRIREIVKAAGGTTDQAMAL